MSYFKNQILHKNQVMKVKPIFLYDVSIRCNLWLKLQKVDKDYGAWRKTRKAWRHNIRVSATSNRHILCRSVGKDFVYHACGYEFESRLEF